MIIKDLTTFFRRSRRHPAGAHVWLTDPARVGVAAAARRSPGRPKVRVAQRVARTANLTGIFEPILGNVIDDLVARRLVDCDCLFLAADTTQARAVFNALVHQYLIPACRSASRCLWPGHASMPTVAATAQ